jgi:hypothetical protein
VVDAVGNERRTGPLAPDVRRMRPHGERMPPFSATRTETPGDRPEAAPEEESQADLSARQTGMRRPGEGAHATDSPRTSPYPRMSPLQVELFVTAYRLTGNIDESLKQAGVNTRYRDHARLIIQQRHLKKEG